MSAENLLEQVVRAQHDTNRLLESLIAAFSAGKGIREDSKTETSVGPGGHLGPAQGPTQRTAFVDVGRWKRANPLLSAACREAADTLTKVQNIVIGEFAAEVVNESETLKESHFTRRELIDRYGPQLQQLHWLSSLVNQLGCPLAQDNSNESAIKEKVRQGNKGK